VTCEARTGVVLASAARRGVLIKLAPPEMAAIFMASNTTSKDTVSNWGFRAPVA
jgi:hypothetical protein